MSGVFYPVPTYRDTEGNCVQFVPIPVLAGKIVPGYSHRVVINNKAVDWLAEYKKPSIKTAVYFFNNHS